MSFYASDPDKGFYIFETEHEAKACVKDWLTDRYHDAWPKNSDEVEWGLLLPLGRVEKIMSNDYELIELPKE